MMSRSSSALLGLLLGSLVPGVVGASPVHSVVIGVNAAPGSSLERLSFADDDACRMASLLAVLGPVELLTTMDEDTRAGQRNNPVARKARAPTLANLRQALDRTFRRLHAALQRGENPTLIVFYAGHGVADDTGVFFTLQGDQLTRRLLEKLVLSRQPAVTTHLIIDACNSFGFVQPRKPGGTWTPAPVERKPATPTIVDGYPHVGVFTATTPDATTHETSLFRAGVFTHVVLSGFLGAADTNQDGRLTYEEMAIFTKWATTKVNLESLKITFYMRPPRQKPDTPVLDFRAARAVPLRIDPEQSSRFTLFEISRQALADFHSHAELPVSLWLVPGDERMLLDRNTRRLYRVKPTEENFVAWRTRGQPLRLGQLEWFQDRGGSAAEMERFFHVALSSDQQRLAKQYLESRAYRDEVHAVTLVAWGIPTWRQRLEGVHFRVAFEAHTGMDDLKSLEPGVRLEAQAPLWGPLHFTVALGWGQSEGLMTFDHGAGSAKDQPAFTVTRDLAPLLLGIAWPLLPWGTPERATGHSLVRQLGLSLGLEAGPALLATREQHQTEERSAVQAAFVYAGRLDLTWQHARDDGLALEALLGVGVGQVVWTDLNTGETRSPLSVQIKAGGGVRF